MSVVLSGVQRGWTVYTADGKKIGEVDEVHPTYLKVRKGLVFKKDVYVPAGAVSQIRGTEVHLGVLESQIGDLGWDTAPFATGGRPPGSRAVIQRLPYEPEVAPLVDRVFSPAPLRIPVRGERVEVEKTPVITGEVAVTKERRAERETATATTRKLDVDVEQRVDEQRATVRRGEGTDTGAREERG